MRTYGQFCPIAVASEVFTERWTPLIVRELLVGSTRFNELRRGIPLISPSLLSKRLRTLETVGIVERCEDDHAVEYRLTPAGEELEDVVMALGQWGQRWARAEVKSEHLDASLLMWDIHRNVNHDAVPDARTVVHFHLRGSTDGKSHFWLVLEPDDVDVCLIDPGHHVDLNVETHVRTMVEIWMGDTTFEEAVRTGALVIDGPRHLVRQLPSWYALSPFAPVERPAR